MIERIHEFIVKLVDKNLYWTNTMGLARSILALGTLLTFIFNDNITLFNHGINNEELPLCNGFTTISIFCILDDLWLAKSISCFILLSVVIGTYPRITAVFHWWVSYSFANSSHVIDGGDQIASILTFLLIPICIFDKRRWHWSISYVHHSFYEKTIAFFTYFLIKIQVALIYFHSSVGKYQVTEWVNGTALYYWFNNSMFGANEYMMVIFEPILKSPILLTISTWGVLAFELFLASCIFIKNRYIRVVALVIGILFHFFIILVHGLVSFFFVMCAALILYLISKNHNYVRNRNF